MTLKGKIFNFISKDLFNYTASDIMSALLSIVLSSYILVELNSNDLGKYTTFFMMLAFFKSCTNVSNGPFLTKNYFRSEGGLLLIMPAFSCNLTFIIILLPIYIILSKFIPSYFHTEYFFPIVLVESFVFPLITLLRLKKDSGNYFRITISHQIAYLFILLILVYQNSFSLENVFQAYFLSKIFLLSILLILFIFIFKPLLRWSKDDYYICLKEGISLLPHSMSRSINDFLDYYVIQYFLGFESLGIYSMLKRLAKPIQFFSASINKESSVLLSEFYAGKASLTDIQKKEKQYYRILIAINVFVVVFFILYNFFIFPFNYNHVLIFPLLIIYTNGYLIYYMIFNTSYFKNMKISYFYNIIYMLLFVLLFALVLIYDLKSLFFCSLPLFLAQILTNGLFIFKNVNEKGIAQTKKAYFALASLFFLFFGINVFNLL